MNYCEYIHRCQLDQSVKLLTETNMTVKEISWHCGFCTASYFIRTFKDRYGMSPERYRHLKQ